jgi:hypothetical protein
VGFSTPQSAEVCQVFFIEESHQDNVTRITDPLFMLLFDSWLR